MLVLGGKTDSHVARRSAKVLLIATFTALLGLWTFVVYLLISLTYALDGDWTEWVSALDPRGKPTSWWFWYCVLVFFPVTCVAGIALSFVERWRLALLVFPVMAVIDIVGGVVSYVVDRTLL